MNLKLISYEETQLPEVKEYIGKVCKAKEIAIEQNNEKVANDLWREHEALEANFLFIGAFNELKKGNYRQAWVDFEKCEIKCKFLEENSDDDFLSRKRIKFISSQIPKWQALYPYCVFVSPGFTVGYYTCSICNHKIRPRSRCGHEKGKLYNGKLCLHVAHDMNFKEISIVSSPVQKYSVVHDDSTLDFSVLEHLLSFLENAYEDWNYEKKTKKFPRAKFNSVQADSGCPCKSGSVFRECCFNKSDIEIPHIDFIFYKEISEEKQNIKFPY
ncbi:MULTISPECIES: zinc chelation protein SecC [Pseudoalteromonas]|uniref:Zinc chelation protein SecC n=2 Tax=Pseudoalteromonas TaxID=53246 RepID=A0AAD0XEI0_9GAMM|nr:MULTISPECIES: zinc chelation protein SecC [Pseudoalteromonas]AYM88419.1 zinc chelation protein SecC [Pseudoalteromonas agarivorans]MCK8096107.1 hypothetical protein [Pseudoalteromonas sp. 1CM17D]MCP4054885.1 zinc chelation protein SecC [Mesoflavibacter sp.]